MDRAKAEKLRVFEAGNHPKHALLLGIPQPRLEADEIPHPTVTILASQLDDGMCLPTRARIAKADRLHRTKAQRVAAASRHLLDRHAPLEVRNCIEVVR